MKPKWYHWFWLILCIGVLLLMGIGNIIGGPSSDSRYLAIDKIVLPLLSVAMIIFALLLFTRKRWAFTGMMICLILQIGEVLATTNFHQFGTRIPLFYLLQMSFTCAILFGLPFAILYWLRNVFAGKIPTDGDSSP